MGAIIKVENLGKKYTIRHEHPERYVALRDVMAQKAKKLFSFPKHLRSASAKPDYEDFWALKDLNFEINQGDRVGIIGRNGAGKSTLLKILSRITEPSTGRITLNGRVASLLEVGTGFHPELTGRENIFLNGAILGMGRAEIRKKFDEIVDFSGVEKFLDTPVKRYSSGMYVRLAFAVAAHLEPEILVVDEVLAVGDAEFQKKCLGKMEDVSRNEGRTVLFVSHQLQLLKILCPLSIYLSEGSVKLFTDSDTVVNEYFSYEKVSSNSIISKFIEFVKVEEIKELQEPNTIGHKLTIIIKLKENFSFLEKIGLDLIIKDANVNLLFLSSAYHSSIQLGEHSRYLKCTIHSINLAIGEYFIDLHVTSPLKMYIEKLSNVCQFNINSYVNHSESFFKQQLRQSHHLGFITPNHKWEISSLD